MLYRETVRLITPVGGYDAEGYPIPEETTVEVYADRKSVRRSEFYAGKQAGMELKAAFEIMACDYGGQTLVEHDGVRYRVERTYSRDGERVELNCSERGE